MSADNSKVTISPGDQGLSGIPCQFYCPICSEVFLKDVFQCFNGHPICGDCVYRKVEKTCPQCSVSLQVNGQTFIRNRVLEDLMNIVTIQCPFKANGCDAVVPLKVHKVHAKDCVCK